MPQDNNAELNEERSLLVAFYESAVGEMWRVRMSPLPIATERITTISIKGATGNTARYFGSYFQENISVDRSIFLASHIVLSAGRLDQAMVKGLDIAVFKNSACHLLTSDEMDILRTNSLRLDHLMLEQLSKPSGLNTAPSLKTG